MSVRRSQGVAIRYPQAVWHDAAQAWISDAEIGYTAFTSRRKAEHITARLIVRRRPNGCAKRVG